MSKFRYGDYVQLAVGVNPMSWNNIILSDKDLLLSRKRLRVTSDQTPYSIDGLSCLIDDVYLAPFQINYNGTCPFVVGDNIRLRAADRITDRLDGSLVTPQRERLQKHGRRAWLVRSVSVSTYITTESFDSWDWRRFEYADNADEYVEEIIPMGNVAQPAQAKSPEVRCGACASRTTSELNQFESGGYFAYPLSGKVLAWASEFGMNLCPACAESVAKHVMYLKCNGGPTRTGRT
jgi:hypothetical protein